MGFLGFPEVIYLPATKEIIKVQGLGKYIDICGSHNSSLTKKIHDLSSNKKEISSSKKPLNFTHYFPFQCYQLCNNQN